MPSRVIASEIPLLSSFLYLFGESGDGRAHSGGVRFLVLSGVRVEPGPRPAPKTASGGEFDWGGTSVKW